MFKKILLSKIQSGRIRWIGLSLTGASILLLITFIANVALASSYESTPKSDMPSLALQTTATPTPTLQVGSTSVYSFSLATLGYDEITLTSPYGSAQYFFRIPENWSIQTDGVLNIDLSYAYDQVNAEGYPVLFGELTVMIDSQTLEIFPIDERELDHYLLRVPLPSSLLANSGRTQHVIGLKFNAGLLCEIPHRAKLVIHPTSTVSLTYSQHPFVPDLSRYPWPFYQRAFEPDSVRFVLPSQLPTDDLSSSLAMAAKLGDLTGDRLVISATTDVDLLSLLSTDPTIFGEHLIVIGQPQDNQLLSFLNDIADLPVSLHKQQLGLVTQGPAAVSPGDAFTYTFTITNSVDRALNLSLVGSLPPYTELMNCTPGCAENGDDDTVTWSGKQLAPDETISLSLTLKAADVLTGTTLENTVTLLEADLGPINADTLMTPVVTDSSNSGLQVSGAREGDYFFVYEGRAVAKGDGVVQEILSPWSENRAILIVTGLSDEAVRKVSQAMSSETRFPGMSGAVALVRDALPPSEINDPASTAIETTFEDLGYPDQIIYGESLQQVDYWFDAPGWQLTDSASIDLYFNHSQLIDYENSGLTVLLNREPVASLALNDETATNGHMHIDLVNTNVRAAQGNRLSLRVDMSLPGKCANPNSEQAWFLIQNRSKMFWPRDEASALSLALGYFPYPFHANRALTDLLFALPDAPTVDEWEVALRLAEDLGSYAGGKAIVPSVMTGSDLPIEDLRGYHIIAIGRPSRNTLIQRVNAHLPQPFLPGSDEIEQRLDDVVFRLPSGVDLGYLQLIPAPWNETRAFLAVTGTTDEGLKGAIDVLTNQPWALRGDLALVRDGEVNTIDTRGLTSAGVAVAIATAVPEMTPVATTAMMITTPTPASLPSSPTPSASGVERTSGGADRPGWLIPVVALNGIAVIGLLAVAVWRANQKRL